MPRDCFFFMRTLPLALWALASAASINGAQSAESAGPYPPGPGNRVLSATDLVIFEQAHRAGDRNDWRAARRLATQSSDEIAARVVEWRYLLDDDSDASFQDITRFLDRYADWPWRERLLARAEEEIPETLTPAEVMQWFGERKPITSEGSLRLGQAMIAAGQPDEGIEIIRDAWINNTFSSAEESEIFMSSAARFIAACNRDSLPRSLISSSIAQFSFNQGSKI